MDHLTNLFLHIMHGRSDDTVPPVPRVKLGCSEKLACPGQQYMMMVVQVVKHWTCWTHNTTRQYSTTHHMVPVLHTKIHELIIICKTSNNCCGVDCIISSQNMKTSSTAVTKFSRLLDLFWSILRGVTEAWKAKNWSLCVTIRSEFVVRS